MPETTDGVVRSGLSALLDARASAFKDWVEQGWLQIATSDLSDPELPNGTCAWAATEQPHSWTSRYFPRT